MNPRPWWKIVDWRIVLSVAVPFWLLVGGGVYLATAKPFESVGPPPCLPPVEPPPLPFEPPPHCCPSYFPPTTVQAPAPRVVNEVVAAPREVKVETSVLAMIKFLADTIRALPVPRAAPQDSVVEAKPEPIPIPEGCKLHGTTLHFVKSPVEAFKLAPKQDKLVFILHLSGNIEDDGFT